MSDEETLTVSAINRGIGAALKDAFPEPFWVAGELQGYDRDAYKAGTRRWGQVYFELIEKEDSGDTVKASVKALVWGDAHRAIQQKLSAASDKLKLQDGVQVRVLCSVDFYWPRASLQLKVLDADPTFTLGDMERARRELIEKLKASGLFDQNRSVEMPDVPLTLGLLTSEGSAAYHDFLETLRASGYGFRVLAYDARMQGEDTEQSVRRGLASLARRPDVDAIALIRGGGSRSDLIWFDKEAIATAVAGCSKPVVCGIGHEIDLSVADLVAHRSEKTPTAVAQFFIDRVRAFQAGVEDAASGILREASVRLEDRSRELADAVRWWRTASVNVLDRARSSLSATAGGVLSGARRNLSVASETLRHAPGRLAVSALGRASAEKERVTACLPSLRRDASVLLARHAERLDALDRECRLKDPRRLLERGYALVRKDGRALRHAADAQANDAIDIQVMGGRLAGVVTGRTLDELEKD